ncbi:MAG: hypothetical protein KDD64_10145 [Bdellovibrionales bacterium]|nr:hypothetical protein [Bdellovibrionales bacterium]
MKALVPFFLVASLVVLPAAHAEEIDAIFKKVNEYIAQQNFPKALEELNWAQKEINKMHVERLKSFFPDSLAGFTGNQTEVNAALGMTNVERRYSNGAKNVSLSLIGGSGGGPLGNIAGFGRMAAMMGGQPGQDTFRINGLTANLVDKPNNPELTVFLDSGSMLKLEGSGQASGKELREIAEGFDLASLDKYLKGTAS